jgi:NitT/TauT family transport system permease protein
MARLATADASAIEARDVDPRDFVKRPSGIRDWLTTFALRILIIAAFLGLWQLLSDTKVIDPFFVSSPSKVAQRLWDFTSDGTIFHHAWVTLREALKGYIVGSVIGVVIGFILGLSRILSAVFLPLLNLLNTLPRVALAPLFILWFGIGEMSKVVLVFSVVVVILIFNTYAGTQTVDRDIVTNARLLGASRLQVVLKITLPWCLPWIITGMRIALAWSIGAAVIGEYLAARAGLGYLIFYYSGILDQTGLLAGCVVLLILSGFMFGALNVAERYLLRWRPSQL